MNTDSVAYTYAMALSQIDGVDLKKKEAEMILVSEAFQSPEIKLYFDSPTISIADKKEKLKKAFGQSVSKEVLNFLFLVLDKHRETFILSICAGLTEIADKEFNRVRPYVILSRNYPEKELKKIISEIEALINVHRKDFGIENQSDKIEFIHKVEVQPDLLGGIYMRVGDYMWDSSLSRFLKDWKQRVLSGAVDQNAVIVAE
ncbi:MAG: ATP synthase F1 subunit delta [Spirochaetia bacterium]|nr:ATP synthase F1 subunit delta [Spirochaetia bacterium]